MTVVSGCLFRRNMLIGLKMAALGDGTDPPSRIPLVSDRGFESEMCFLSALPASTGKTPCFKSFHFRHVSFAF